MEAFDTNVVVRLLVRDDEEQYQRAERVFRRVTAGPGAWLSSVVLAEVAWVLRGAYKFDRATIAAALHRLIAIDGVAGGLIAVASGSVLFVTAVVLFAGAPSDDAPQHARFTVTPTLAVARGGTVLDASGEF